MRELERGRTERVKGAAPILILAAVAAMGACSRHAPAQSASEARAASPPDYLPPPTPSGAIRRPDGGAILTGTARAGALVRFAAPDGSTLGARADRAGAWTVALPGGPEPRLYALSEDIGGRLVRARGYVALLPAPGPTAVMLRPGAGASPIGPGSGPGVLTLDYDVSGAAVVAGRARPSQIVRVQVDGREAGEDRADDAGAFQVSLSLRPGPHVLTAASAGGVRAAAVVQVSPPAAIPAGPFVGARTQDGWRIDWITPGGGRQSTIVFDRGRGRA